MEKLGPLRGKGLRTTEEIQKRPTKENCEEMKEDGNHFKADEAFFENQWMEQSMNVPNQVREIMWDDLDNLRRDKGINSAETSGRVKWQTLPRESKHHCAVNRMAFALQKSGITDN